MERIVNTDYDALQRRERGQPLQILPGVHERMPSLRQFLLEVNPPRQPGGLERRINLTRVRAITQDADGVRRNRGGGARDEVVSAPILELIPALFLQQTESSIVGEIPVADNPPQNRTAQALNTPILHGIVQSGNVVPNVQVNESLWSQMSPSFRNVFFSGVGVTNRGVFQGIIGQGRPFPNVPFHESNRRKWQVLSQTPVQRRLLSSYLRLVLSRYATSLIQPNLRDPNQRPMQDVQVGESTVGVRIFNASESIFSFIPSMRRVTGLWSAQVSLPGRTPVPMNYNLDILRRYMVQIDVRAEPMDWKNMMTFLYPHIRPRSLFEDSDHRFSYYTQLHIYSQDLMEHGPPSDILVSWMMEHTPRQPLYTQIIDHANKQITKALQSQNDPENAMHYSIYIECIWLRDRRALHAPRRTTRHAPPRIRPLPRALPPPAPVPAPRPAPAPPIIRRRRAREPVAQAPPSSIARRTRSQTRQVSQGIQTRSGTRLRGGAHVAYTEQERMFVKGSMLPSFASDKALLWSPHRPHQTCILMSLFRAERTIYSFVDGRLTDVDKGPHSQVLCEHEYFIPAIEETKWVQARRQPPFFTFVEGRPMLRLSQSIKYKMEGEEYQEKFRPGALDAEEEELWEQGAEELGAYLEVHLERDLDMNDLDEVCQAFADVTGICVHIFDIEFRGSRVQSFTPYQKPLTELLSRTGESTLSMVQIVYDQGHCHAVAHLQEFLTSTHRSRPLAKFQYCPFCEIRSARCMRTWPKASEHISSCMSGREHFETALDQTIHKNMMMGTSPVRQEFRKNEPSFFVCTTCRQRVTQASYLGHSCIVPNRKLDPVESDRLYVYDLESAQVRRKENVWTHECNCVVVRKVYPSTPEEGEGKVFKNEIDFVEALLDPKGEYAKSTFLAHNGGGYDCHFLLRMLERWGEEHTFIPSPTSQHKFLEITISKSQVRILDFMRFVPGSLRNIAKAFGCEVGKGDFPHKFNNGERDSYRGALPPNDPDGEDFWCMRHVRSQKEYAEFLRWYDETACMKYCTCYEEESCTCGKIPWDFQEELVKYCRLDVIVLGEVVRLYREQTMALGASEVCPDSEIDWRPPQIDPFSCMTLPQITMNTLAKGFHHPENHRIVTLHQRWRGGWNEKAIAWLIEEQKQEPHCIFHRGNHIREYFDFSTQTFIDGYCEETHTAYVFLDCEYWGCARCYRQEHEENAWHEGRHMFFRKLEDEFHRWMYEIDPRFHHLKVIWEHTFDETFQRLAPYDREVCRLMKFEDAFYGGRTEVFCPYTDVENTDEEIEYHDVTSLYPSVYLKTLPMGRPYHVLGEQIDKTRLHPTASHRYFGFGRFRVTPRNTDLIGILPQRDRVSGRLTFPVHPMVGCWGTEELFLAMQHGYILEEVYEMYYWEEGERSDQYLRGYVGYFLRMKQEAEGWKKLGAQSHSPDVEEQQTLVDRLYIQNGQVGRIRPECVEVNPVKRQLAKLYLNSLWGKFAQKEASMEMRTLYGPQQFLEIWSDPAIVKESFTFRETSPGVYKARFQMQAPFRRHVPHGNLLLAAKVTETARCVLHTRMFKIGPERVLYCDTDSIIMKRPRGSENLLGVGLGHWTNEYPDDRIVRCAALAPKMYVLEFAGKGEDEQSVRAKGIQLSLRNKRKMRMKTCQELLLPIVRGEVENEKEIELDMFQITTNYRDVGIGYGAHESIEGVKKGRVVLHKREIVIDSSFIFDETHRVIRTTPLGYAHHEAI